MISAEQFTRLRSAVLKNRPVLKTILETKGAMSAFDYAKGYAVNTRVTDAKRKEECIAEITALTQELLGKEARESIERQLTEHYYASTTDHHGPLMHPFFVHANLLAASPQVEASRASHENTLVLACSNVSLGNSSFPRSLLFHDELGTEHRLHFFPASERLSPVFRFRAYTAQDLERMQHSLNSMGLSPKLTKNVSTLLQEIYGTPEALSASNFASQITITNEALWQNSFSETRLPRLITLSIEEVCIRLLLKHHLDAPTELHQFLFDAEILNKVEVEFDGLPSAFSRKEHRGTFHFWYLPEGARARIALIRNGAELVSTDGTYVVPLTPEGIGALLAAQILIPSMMLSLMTLSQYYGLKCLGGFSQVNYLTEFELAYRKVFSLPPAPDDDFTKNLCGEFIIGLLEADGKHVPATGLDFALYSTETSWTRFIEAAEQLTLEEAHSLMHPDLYRVSVAGAARESDLAALTYSDMETVLGLSEKLVPTLYTNNLT
ncbi:MAG: hypothetical protein AAB472_01345 [Patescibacteria group bacterium]